MHTVLGFDVGAKRIGVAVGNLFTQTANPVGVLRMLESGPDWPQLERWMREWKPDAFVIGDPIGLDGEDQPSRKRARVFAEQLKEKFPRTVFFVDERHTSQEAAQRFAQQRAEGQKRRKDAEELDAYAAAIIVERWLLAAPSEG
jgi:putative holliday junction resolvase